jgi:hypothetical protein
MTGMMVGMSGGSGKIEIVEMTNAYSLKAKPPGR